MPTHYDSPFEVDKASVRYYSLFDVIKTYVKVIGIWLGNLGSVTIKLGKAVILMNGCSFRVTKNSYLQFGNHIVIHPNVHFLMTMPNPKLILDDHVSIDRNSLITIKDQIKIGANTRIGAFVTIRDNMHEPFTSIDQKIQDTKAEIKKVNIGKNVWIGNYVTILPGVSIGDGAVIAMYSIVNKDIPANMVAAGQPARIINPRFKNEK